MGPGISLGLPAFNQSMYILYNAMQAAANAQYSDFIINKVIDILNTMDTVEGKLIQAQDRLAASDIGRIKTRRDEEAALEHEYIRWGYRLSDLLASPPNPYSARYQAAAMGFNVPLITEE